MSAPKTDPPKISITMHLEPTTYHFSNPCPPTLSFTLTSHASSPLTILIPHSSPLAVARAMNTGSYPISSLSTSPPTPLKIGDMSGTISLPPSRNELLTLQPGSASKTFSVAFNRGGSYDLAFRPQPWEVVRRGRVLDSEGNETGIRRPSVVHGVDGLEAGKMYRVGMAVGKLEKVPWWWGGEDGEPERERLEEFVGGIEWEVVDGGVEFAVEE